MRASRSKRERKSGDSNPSCEEFTHDSIPGKDFDSRCEMYALPAKGMVA
jgi:hypothetical protein